MSSDDSVADCHMRQAENSLVHLTPSDPAAPPKDTDPKRLKTGTLADLVSPIPFSKLFKQAIKPHPREYPRGVESAMEGGDRNRSREPKPHPERRTGAGCQPAGS